MKKLQTGDSSNDSTDEIELQNVVQQGHMEFEYTNANPQTINYDSN